MSDSKSLVPLPHPKAGWQFSLYPEAGEGGGSFRRWVPKPAAYVARGQAADPERSALESGKRARRTLRRYCAANRLNRLGTLTYAGAGCHEPEQIRADLAEFFRELRTQTGGNPFPYVWVPEWHKSGHGLHAHFAVGQFIRRSHIESAWGRGFVHIKLLGDLPVGTGSLGQARKAAGYLSKYVTKTFTDPDSRVLGLHRYDVAQGFQPQSVMITGTTVDEVLEQSSALFGEHPARQWSSAETEDWQGPPSIWAQWGN